MEEKEKAEETNTEVLENVEVKEESLVFDTVNTNNTEAPKKKGKKKVEDNGTE